jgi:hypothetical protein
MACALATGVLAQGTLAPRNSQNTQNTQQAQNERQRLTPARLTVPVTGTVGTTPTLPADTSAAPAQPSDPSSAAPVEPTALVDGALQPEVTGSFSIQRFARTTNEGVGAVGTLILSFRDPTSNAQRAVVTQLARPIEMSGGTPALGGPETPAATASISSPPVSAAGAAPACETLSLTLGALDLDVNGVAVQLDEVNIDFTTVDGGARQFEALLCNMAGQIEGATGSADLVKTLNTLLESIG